MSIRDGLLQRALESALLQRLHDAEDPEYELRMMTQSLARTLEQAPLVGHEPVAEIAIRAEIAAHLDSVLKGISQHIT